MRGGRCTATILLRRCCRSGSCGCECPGGAINGGVVSRVEVDKGAVGAVVGAIADIAKACVREIVAGCLGVLEGQISY